MREKQGGQEITFLLLAYRIDTLVVGWPFCAIVTGAVIIMPVIIIFAIGFIIFVVIRHQIVQREAVMGSNKVNA
ncbi:Uncharacterised protein [Salmonella enterica subsp. enterica serovar Bovismorbificans]|nr:Uncharacterised protein [Salmonella enterica subsp. enterica serovar Bovismorbificans]CPR42256.1 Uncharacterised protein [Salmonella enterica subsp. enterica serovar Bovismorbificans]